MPFALLSGAVAAVFVLFALTFDLSPSAALFLDAALFLAVLSRATGEGGRLPLLLPSRLFYLKNARDLSRRRREYARARERLSAFGIGAGSRVETAVTPYFDGAAFFASLADAMRGAEDYIFLEYYIVSDGEIFSRLKRILCEKARGGVDCRLLSDGFGTAGRLSEKSRAELLAAGVRLATFSPLSPLRPERINARDHRKIAVVDGSVAFSGGINLGDEYAKITKPYGDFKDAGVRFSGGDAARFLAGHFLAEYDAAAKKESDLSRFLSVRAPAPVGGEPVFLFATAPKEVAGRSLAKNTLLSVIRSARKRLWIATPYFLPDGSVERALLAAKRRGVDVRILLPGVPDKKLARFFSFRAAAVLAREGIGIRLYTPGFLHEKCVVSDGRALVGSQNVDLRSFFCQREIGALLSGCAATAFARDLEAAFSASERICEPRLSGGRRGALLSAILYPVRKFY